MFTVSRWVIIVVLVLGVVIAVSLRHREASSTTTAAVGTTRAPAVLDAARTPATPTARLPRLLDIGADKCIPCKAMVPVLEALRREYAGALQVDFIDAWKYPEQAEPFKVYAIPVQIFFDASGRELHRHLGFISKEEILETWRKLGVRLTATQKG